VADDYAEIARRVRELRCDGEHDFDPITAVCIRCLAGENSVAGARECYGEMPNAQRQLS
jgi:hypothetical protein